MEVQTSNKTFDRFFCFDTETVGLSPNYIISLSYRYHEKGKSPIIGELLLNPNYPINPKASETNGFTEDMVKDWPLFAEKWGEIEPLMRDSVWIGHNVGFDIRAVKLECDRYCIPIPHHYELDTLTLARLMVDTTGDNAAKNHKLISLCEYFNLEINEEEFHGSAYDILMTEAIYKQLKMMNKQVYDGKYDDYFIPKEVEGEYTLTAPCKKKCDDYDY